MTLRLLAVLTAGLTTANVSVSVIALALGTFVVISPDKAVKIWGSERFDKLAPEGRASLINWYRVFGFFLLLGGALFAIDNILSVCSQ